MKNFKTLKYASTLLAIVIISVFICITDAQAASHPIGSLKFPIGTHTNNFSDTSNLYPFKYQGYNERGTTNYRILSIQSQVYKSGLEAQNILLQNDSTTQKATVGQTWYIFNIRLNFHPESTFKDAFDVTSFFGKYSLVDKSGKDITVYDYDNNTLNYKNYGSNWYTIKKILPGYYLNFYYAVLIDSSVTQPLVKVDNYIGALTDNSCYLSLDTNSTVYKQNKKDICNGSAKITTVQTYTGKAKTTSYTVYDKQGNPLTKGTDYTVSYYNNIKPGVATVKFTGIGEYEGIIEKYFYIKPVMTNLTFSNVTDSSSKLSWKAVPNADYYKVYKYNTSKKKYVYLKTVYSTSTNVSGMASAYTYKYAVYPYTKAKDPYTGLYLTNSSNSIVTITGSLKTKSVTTRPKAATMKKITRPAKKTLSVWWSKSTRASGYKIVVSTGYGMKGVLKTYYTTSTAKKITGLPSGKYVYVNVIPYKTVGKVKLYSTSYYYYYTKVS